MSVLYSILSLLMMSKLIAGQNSDPLFKFHQNDYKIHFERVELIRYNSQYIDFLKVTTFKYNRTTPVVNATGRSHINIGTKLEVVAQVFKFMSNEYRIFPIRLQANACDAISKNVIGITGITTCGNFSGCPLRNGIIYHVCHFTIDQAKFPPLIPNGKYMVELQFLYLEHELAVIDGYGSVARPI